MNEIYAKVVSGALGLPFWERCGFHFGTTTFWEIFPDFFSQCPIQKNVSRSFLYKRWLWPIPQSWTKYFLHGSMVLKGFGGASPSFVSLVSSFKQCGDQNTKISHRTQSYETIWTHTCFLVNIGVGIYWWCRREENGWYRTQAGSFYKGNSNGDPFYHSLVASTIPNRKLLTPIKGLPQIWFDP